MRAQGCHASFVNSLRFLVIFFVLCLPQTMRAQSKEAKPSPTSQGTQQNLNPGADRVLINTDLISFNVTVMDQYGRFVTGLSQSAFAVFDDKQAQEITFFSDEDAPVSLGIVFDLTGSMSATAFYDACYLGVDKVTRGTHPKRALLVISDGQDNNSRFTFNELRRLVKESDVIIYAIGIEEERDGMLGSDGQSILDAIASVSGGKAFFPHNSTEMNDIFESIALELRHQYAIGYRPSNFDVNGKWHHLKVKVNPPRGLPHLFVRSRDGYYALTHAH